jgi:hypothetical protein
MNENISTFSDILNLLLQTIFPNYAVSNKAMFRINLFDLYSTHQKRFD